MRSLVARCVIVLAAAVLMVSPLAAQPPLQLNTTVLSFTLVPASPWVADIWSYIDPLGREFALVCRGNSGMSCYEITNPAAPVFASSIPATGSDMKDVKVYYNPTGPDYAFALQQSGGTVVVDLSDPYNMQSVFTISGSAHNGFVYQEQALYLQARNGANPANCRIYDISNPAAPVLLGAWDPPSGDTHDVYAQDNLAYVNVLFGSVEDTYILDISNPSSPQFLHRVPSGTRSHACWMYNAPGGGKFLCEANEIQGGHLKIFDVTDNLNTPLVAEYVTDPNISIHNPVVEGRYCYIAYYADYLRILDMARPANPVEIGTFDPVPNNAGASVFDGAWGVSYLKPLGGGAHRLLLTESFTALRGFWVIDFTPPVTPIMDLTTTGVGDVNLTVSDVLPFTTVYNPISATVSQNVGAGPVAGLAVDALNFLINPAGPPFQSLSDGSGNYNFSAPAGTLPAGLTIDVVTIAQTTSGWQVGQVGRITF